MEFLTVKEIAKKLNKNEETIKRWIRKGKFPNAFKKTDKQGWRIPKSDFEMIYKVQQTNYKNEQKPSQFYSSNEIRELVILAYQAVTLTYPTEEIIRVLELVGIKRALEVLLIMQQSPSKIKNPNGFIRKAISENWCVETLPKRLPKQQKISLANSNEAPYRDLTQSGSKSGQILFYNWLNDNK